MGLGLSLSEIPFLCRATRAELSSRILVRVRETGHIYEDKRFGVQARAEHGYCGQTFAPVESGLILAAEYDIFLWVRCGKNMKRVLKSILLFTPRRLPVVLILMLLSVLRNKFCRRKVHK
jgi:hypothetical protein